VSEEARRNTIALLIAAVLILVSAAFAFRPAVLLPVSDHAVADSLTSAADAFGGDCLHADEGFRCDIRIGDPSRGSATRRLLVHVDWDGCWRAVETAPKHSQLQESGCVHLWNY
jgi:hypothetical protein